MGARTRWQILPTLACIAGCGSSGADSSLQDSVLRPVIESTAADAPDSDTGSPSTSAAPSAPVTSAATVPASTTDTPSPAASDTTTPAQWDIQQAADLIGLSFSVPLSTTIIEARLHLQYGMNIANQGCC
jgi:hypothetical protein